MQDYFFKWIEVYAMPNKTALSFARNLVHFMSRYRCIEKLHSDLGREFKAHVMEHLYDLRGVKKTFTTPYTLIRWVGRARQQNYSALAEGVL